MDKTKGMQRGSLSWHCVRLKPGDTYLVADNGSAKQAQMRQMTTTLTRLQERAKGTAFKIRTCYGQPFEMKGLEKTFRFYQIERLK